MPEAPGLPQTFKELLDLDGTSRPHRPCQRCGKRSTHRVSLSATKLHQYVSDDGQNGKKRRGGPPPGVQVARHHGFLCEPCAVLVYAKFVEVIK
jgi:hypothetical protein